VFARTIKDLICRFQVAQGRQVTRKAGWDTHGLPVELEVEKQLGFKGKQDIEAYGVEKFNALCRQSVMRYEEDWRRLTERIGYWLDMDEPYITFTNDYIESVWWILRQIWDRDLMYKGHKVVPYCPRCGTPLSSHEVALGYEEVVDPSVYVRFRVPNERASFLVWTTTPWTLPANVALAVHPDVAYVRVRAGDEELILAKELAERVLDAGYEVLEERPGREWVGMRYEPLFPFFAGSGDGDPFRVVEGEFVTTEEGTGIVHIAPAYGEEDLAVASRAGLPIFHPVDDAGRYTAEVPPWQGMFVKDADAPITDELDRRGLLFRRQPYRHTYPFCWRCHTPLLYYARASWFIRMSALRDRLLAANETIEWYPAHLKAGRFGNWLENISDWALSRNRFWGTPLPIWRCTACDACHCVGSVAELKEMALDAPESLDLHKPYVDRIALRCPRCGGRMQREPEVIDVWFDSGAMPLAQWHYPFENAERFKEQFPADYICEAIDQTRGWFYSLLAISVLLFDRSCYRNCLSLELVLDAQGQKMSKSRGNAIDPWTILDRQGADALRWHFCTVNLPWEPKRLSLDGVTESLRRFQLTLWNVHVFFTTYAALDGFDPGCAAAPPIGARPPLDRWLLSRLHGVIGAATAALDRYNATAAARSIEAFVDELSNWYVRRSRRRFWRSEASADKAAAYATLYEVLTTLARLIAPFTPFLAERLYQDLVVAVDAGAAASVHLTDWPKADPSLIDAGLEESMAKIRRLVGLGRAARNRAGIKVRQPLSRAVVPAESVPAAHAELLDQLAEELNVRAVEQGADVAAFLDYEVKPRLDRLGPRLGRRLPALQQALAAPPAAAVRAWSAGLPAQIEVDGGPVELSADDVMLRAEPRPGFAVEEDPEAWIALDVEITDELRRDGLVRELIHQIQGARKEAGFAVDDRIAVAYRADP
ncbi:MAG TPA: isoleucine--tRNA ligase, partial [Limnochordia bacterium]